MLHRVQELDDKFTEIVSHIHDGRLTENPACDLAPLIVAW